MICATPWQFDSLRFFWKAHYVQFVSKLPEKNAEDVAKIMPEASFKKNRVFA
jgi:type IV secretory pathway VirJ component